MPKCRRKPEIFNADFYEPGMEDGFDVVATGWWERWKWENGGEVFHRTGENRIPYMYTLQGKEQITPGDLIITDSTGNKKVIKPPVFARIYEWVEDIYND